MIPGVIISAISSNSGKTAVSVGLMRSLARMGKKVAPYKCGPDYIDTKFHDIAAHNTSINLDLFLASANHLTNIFQEHAKNADFAVVEGVMGLFDGYDYDKGSVAQIAKLLKLPVVLVVDASSSGFSMAALLSGYKNFDKDIEIVGVIFNFVTSNSHYSLLAEACRRANIECLGCIPRNKALDVPSRHLGLLLSTPKSMNDFADEAADSIERNLNLSIIFQLMKKHEKRLNSFDNKIIKSAPFCKPKLTVGIAKDDAFSFIYAVNIMALRHHQRYDVKIEYFSPLYDKTIPNADLIYLPGGYPELYANCLAYNQSMLDSIHGYATSGGRIFAECGGMMYLCKNIDSNKMCDILPLEATMNDAKLTLGYRTITTEQGFTFKGHEFHYSSILHPDSLPTFAKQQNVRGKSVNTPLYRVDNVIAGYTHFYWGETDILRLFGL